MRSNEVGVRRWVALVCTALVGGSLAACTPVPRSAPVTAPASPDDPALVARSVLAPGNGSPFGFTATHVDDQREMYDSLDDPVADGTLRDADLGRYFKDTRDGAAVPVRVDHPRPGTSVAWDGYGVPDVRGATADDVAFGAGWAVAEARLIVAELGRTLGRAGAIEMGGAGGDLITAVKKLGQVPQINYTDPELDRNLAESIAAAGDQGPAISSAIDAFVAGINDWIDHNPWPQPLRDLGLGWRHWSRADIVAVGIIVDDIFGSGGGDEVGNAAALRALTEREGAARGMSDYIALRKADDPAATTHVAQRFDYPQYADHGGANVSPDNEVDLASVAIPDAPAGAAAGAVAAPAHAEKPTASNVLAIAGQRSASGHPILVGGPQSSYFAPELLFELGLHGGGYDSSGITFPGLGPWVVIGRSSHHAWTATAGGSDLIDERVERLCEPDGSPARSDSNAYVFDGECRAMSRPDEGTMTAWRTVHGPVISRTTVAGAPVAITRQRASRFQTAQATRAFWALNQGQVRTAQQFTSTMSAIPMSFNWVYANATDIAYFHSGFYPVRARGTAYDLPTWGTGEWEWRGLLTPAQHPQVIDPAAGYLVSWNNKVAPGWRTADNDWGVGATERVDLIRERAETLHDATPADVVAAVQDAGTVDLRGEMLVPRIAALMRRVAAPSELLGRTLDRLVTWASTGAHRRDRDGDGFYDDPMVPVMDALFPALLGEVFRTRLGRYLDDEEVRRPRITDMLPALTGSAWGHGWYSILARDLADVVAGAGDPFCGEGSPDACATRLWAAVGDALMVAGHGLRKWTALERIRFIPFLGDLESMRWVNRPTYQQVMSFRD